MKGEHRRARARAGVLLAALVSASVLACAATPADAALSNRPARSFVTDGSVQAILPTDSAVYIGGSFTSVGPRTGPAAEIDAATAKRRFAPAVSGARQEVLAVAPDGSGGFYVGGSFNRVGTTVRRGLAHFLPSGRLDPNFVSNTAGVVRALALSGGRLYVGGTFRWIDGEPRAMIAALDPASGTVSDWNPNPDHSVTSIAVSRGTVYAGGDFDHIGGKARSFLAALDPDTGQATSWNPELGNWGRRAQVYALAASGHTVYVGGHFGSIGGAQRHYLGAVDANTGQATPWRPDPAGTVSALAISGDTVYAGGYFTEIGGRSRLALAAVDAATGNASAWDPSPSNGPYDTHVDSLAVSGGTVYAGGAFDSIGGRTRRDLAALGADTGRATDWDPRVNGTVEALGASDSAVYAGGRFTSVGARTRDGIAALDPIRGWVTPWNPGAHGSGPFGRATIDALAVSGTTVYAGGVFDSIGGRSRSNLAALDATTGQATSWNPDVQGDSHAGVRALGLRGGTVYAGGAFTTVGGRPRENVVALDSATGTATAWNPGADNSVYGLATSGPLVYVTGAFDTIGGRPRNHIAAVSAAGDVTPWDPNASNREFFSPVVPIVVSGNTVYAGGSFDSIGGQPRNLIAALDASTGLATDWNPNVRPGSSYAPGSVNAIAVSGDRVFTGGWFNFVGDQARPYLAAIGADGTATPWNPAPGSAVYALAVGPDGSLWVGGSFRGFPSAPQSGVARFAP